MAKPGLQNSTGLQGHQDGGRRCRIGDLGKSERQMRFPEPSFSRDPLVNQQQPAH